VGEPVGIAGVAYAMPRTFVELEELESRGMLDSKASAMREFGFRGAYVSDRPADELALAALRSLIDAEGIDPATIDLLIYAGAIPESQCVISGGPLDGFAYPVSRLQYEAGLEMASAFGVSQTGCAGLMAAVALASDHLHAHPQAKRVICVSADVLPAGVKREIIYNVISDGACAVLVERAARRNRIVGYRRIAKGYYWNPDACRNELVAAYFPTARTIISGLLQQLHMGVEEVSLILPHNVSLRSWQILLPLVGFSPNHLFADNIAAKGQTSLCSSLTRVQHASSTRLRADVDRNTDVAQP
jgi:3-oxoacyl-[acyl-carrier-protein] synthase-3